MNHSTYPPDAEEMEEIRYVHSLVAEELRIAEAYFLEKYPDGAPFVPQEGDLEFLDRTDETVRKGIASGRDRYGWTDYDVEGFVALVRIRLSMRFKRVEREIAKLPDWNVLVEEILESENSDGKADGEVLRKKPGAHLRIVPPL